MKFGVEKEKIGVEKKRNSELKKMIWQKWKETKMKRNKNRKKKWKRNKKKTEQNVKNVELNLEWKKIAKNERTNWNYELTIENWWKLTKFGEKKLSGKIWKRIQMKKTKLWKTLNFKF